MNILVPHSWLKDYLKTDATPEEIAHCLNLCGPSVEKIEKVGKDLVYYIEVTPNRPDCFSIIGIAREAAAILPRFNLPAKFINDPYLKQSHSPDYETKGENLPLRVKIENQSLCPRFTAVISDNIQIKPSPEKVQKRLSMVGIRALNNVIDASNYLMVAFGQPVHTFDYDKIKKAKMILREAKRGEAVITLDGQKRIMPGNDIVIEDGDGRLIDLCGIMGAQNSAIDEKTQRVLLFVQTYEPSHIRQTSLSLPLRTEAAARFEKGIDPELVIPTIHQGIQWLKDWAGGEVTSKIFDIYPYPFQPKTIKFPLQLIKQQLGIPIQLNEVVKILKSLGFKTLEIGPPQVDWKLEIQIPSWRASDISLPEDLIEEVARIYGYHRLPSKLMATAIPEDQTNSQFFWEKKIKNLLSHWGLTEVSTYSLQGESLIEKSGLHSKNYLKLKNPLSEDLKILRGSLIPSILSVISDNQARLEEIKIFEIANIYLKKAKNLPEEKPILCAAINGQDKFYQAKGYTEVLFEQMGIKSLHYRQPESSLKLWHPTKTALIYSEKKFLGVLGEIHPQILANFGIEKPVVFFNLDFQLLTQLATTKKTYQPIPQFPAISQDLCFLVPPKTAVKTLLQLIKQSSSIIKTVTLIDSFQNQRTIRIIFQHPKRTLKEEEVEKIRRKTIKEVNKKLKVRLKK